MNVFLIIWGAFVMLFLGSILGRSSITRDIKHFDKFRADGMTYECKETRHEQPK